MSNNSTPNAFQYAFTEAEVAKYLSDRLSAAAKVLRAADDFYYPPQVLRGQVHVVLSQLEMFCEDARTRVVELRQLDAAESLEQAGDQ